MTIRPCDHLIRFSQTGWWYPAGRTLRSLSLEMALDCNNLIRYDVSASASYIDSNHQQTATVE